MWQLIWKGIRIDIIWQWIRIYMNNQRVCPLYCCYFLSHAHAHPHETKLMKHGRTPTCLTAVQKGGPYDPLFTVVVIFCKFVMLHNCTCLFLYPSKGILPREGGMLYRDVLLGKYTQAGFWGRWEDSLVHGRTISDQTLLLFSGTLFIVNVQDAKFL